MNDRNIYAKLANRLANKGQLGARDIEAVRDDIIKNILINQCR